MYLLLYFWYIELVYCLICLMLYGYYSLLKLVWILERMTLNTYYYYYYWHFIILCIEIECALQTYT